MAPQSPVPASVAADEHDEATHRGERANRDLRLAGLAVSQVVGRLQSGYRRDAPWAVASVARLRREAGRDAYVSPGSWGLVHLETLAELRETQRMAEQEARGAGRAAPAYLTSSGYLSREDQERREDNGVHLAVTLWALHQQSLRDAPMHVPGWPLGRAVRRLAHGGTGTHDGGTTRGTDTDRAPDAESDAATARPASVEEADGPVRKRFVRVGNASDIEVLATRLRELVLLLRSSRIPLDYARLADHLTRWQDENARDEIRRIWGRDFHRRYRAVPDSTPGEEQSPAETPLASHLDEAEDGGF
ncbi:type I-E CRISPR-associated protein Cse2/CasB [Streptomyces sp. NPDC088789]|uniref:type I-E CRISPR-associated protein Cse2/CasB n=1 Tax=Streptomyces sp. NPDC088789 TaxID=3365899 RepID=UPI00381CCC3D